MFNCMHELAFFLRRQASAPLDIVRHPRSGDLLYRPLDAIAFHLFGTQHLDCIFEYGQFATSNQPLSCFCGSVILLKNLLVLVCGAKATRAIVMFFGNPRMRVI